MINVIWKIFSFLRHKPPRTKLAVELGNDNKNNRIGCSLEIEEKKNRAQLN